MLSVFPHFLESWSGEGVHNFLRLPVMLSVLLLVLLCVVDAASMMLVMVLFGRHG